MKFIDLDAQRERLGVALEDRVFAVDLLGQTADCTTLSRLCDELRRLAAYRAFGEAYDCAAADEQAPTFLSLPVRPSLHESAQDRVIESLLGAHRG